MKKMNPLQKIAIVGVLCFSSIGQATCDGLYIKVTNTLYPAYQKTKRNYEKNYRYGEGTRFDRAAVSMGLKKETKEQKSRREFVMVDSMYSPYSEAYQILNSASLENQTGDGGATEIRTEQEQRDWKALIDTREKVGEKLTSQHEQDIESKKAFNLYITDLYNKSAIAKPSNGTRDLTPAIQSNMARIIRQGNEANEFCKDGKLATAEQIRSYVAQKWTEEQGQFMEQRKFRPSAFKRSAGAK